MPITYDIEVVKNNNKYRVSDNPFTLNDVIVTSFDVQGAGYNREFNTVERLNGRFLNATTEEKKVINMKLRYSVSRPSYVSHLKSEIQNLFSGQFYLRELSSSDNTIEFLGFNDPDKTFELDYTDGRQIFVGLTNAISFDSTQTSGEIELEFETIDLPYFESIAYNTELSSNPNMEFWGLEDDVAWNENDDYRKNKFYNIQDGYYYYLGDVTIDQFNQNYYVEIVLGKDTKDFTFYIGNHDLMRITGLNLKAGDKIKYNGLQTFKNGISIDSTSAGTHTSGAQPVLEPGANNFHFNQEVQSIYFKHKLYFR